MAAQTSAAIHLPRSARCVAAVRAGQLQQLLGACSHGVDEAPAAAQGLPAHGQREEGQCDGGQRHGWVVLKEALRTGVGRGRGGCCGESGSGALRARRLACRRSQRPPQHQRIPTAPQRPQRVNPVPSASANSSAQCKGRTQAKWLCCPKTQQRVHLFPVSTTPRCCTGARD